MTMTRPTTPATVVLQEHIGDTLNKLKDAVLKTYIPCIINTTDHLQDYIFLGENCIMSKNVCYGDNRDATYFTSFPEHTINDNLFHVVTGVNHMSSSTGATYSSPFVGSTVKKLGIKNFNSREHMESSCIRDDVAGRGSTSYFILHVYPKAWFA